MLFEEKLYVDRQFIVPFATLLVKGISAGLICKC